MRSSTGRRLGISRGISLKPVGLPICLHSSSGIRLSGRLRKLENVGDLQGETGQYITAVHRVALAENAIRPVSCTSEYGQRFLRRIDNPRQASSRLKILNKLLRDLGLRIPLA